MDIQTKVPGLDILIGTTSAQTLIDSEIPLPEGRTADEVLSVTARLLTEEAACHTDAVLVGGRLSLQLLCRAAGGEPFGFSAVSGFTHTVALAGTAEGMCAIASGQLLECSCTAERGQLRLSAVLEVRVRVTACAETPLITALSGEGIETRTGRIERRSRVLLREYEEHLREEISAPNIARVLLSNGSAQIRDVSASGGSVTAEGALYLTVLAAASDGQLSLLSQILPFTSVFEAETLPNCWATVTVDQLHVMAADESFGVADVEARLTLRLYGVDCDETDVITDAYDAAGSFTCVQSMQDALLAVGASQKRFLLREGIRIPTHLPEAYRTVMASAIPAVTGTFDCEGKLGVDLILFTSLLYQCDGGRLHSFTEDIPVQAVLDCAYVPDADVSCEMLAVQAMGSGRTPELQFTLEITAECYETVCLRAAAELLQGAEQPPWQGILIYCADVDDTLWSIGKRFLVPLSQLSAWNGPISEPLREGQQILLIK